MPSLSYAGNTVSSFLAHPAAPLLDDCLCPLFGPSQLFLLSLTVESLLSPSFFNFRLNSRYVTTRLDIR